MKGRMQGEGMVRESRDESSSTTTMTTTSTTMTKRGDQARLKVVAGDWRRWRRQGRLARGGRTGLGG